MIIKTHGNKSAEELWSKLENGINIRVQEDINELKRNIVTTKQFLKIQKSI